MRRRVYSITIICTIIVFFVYDFLRKAPEKDTVTDSNIYKDSIPANYKIVLNPKYRNLKLSGLLFTKGVFFRHRKPVLTFLFKKQFKLVLHEIKSDYIGTLNDFIKITNGESSITYHKNYYLFEGKIFQLQFSATYPLHPDAITVKLNGVNTFLKNDTSKIYIHSLLKDFSIKYYQQENIDVYGEAVDEFIRSRVPIEIMFVKKNKSVFMAILLPEKSGINLETGLLRTLIN